MSTGLQVRDSLGERLVRREDLPLAIGGPGCAITLPDLPPEPLGWIGLHNDELFLQPNAAAGNLLHNGTMPQQSTWLRVGDVITAGTSTVHVELHQGARLLTVRDGGPGNVTAPPIVIAGKVQSGTTDADVQPITGVRYQRTQASPTSIAARRAPLLAWAAGAITVGALFWYLVNGAAVQIVTDPPGARVRLTGSWLTPHIGDQWFVPKGSYVALAERTGYRPARQAIAVTDDAVQSHRIVMAKLPGSVRIAVPVAGSVRIDGGDPQPVPATVELTAGKHHLAVQVPDFLPFEMEFEVTGEGQAQTVQPALVPDWANVTVRSTPDGAQLLIDGKPAGATPLTQRLKAGTHAIELQRLGFKPWRTDVLVKANEHQTLGPIELGLPDGTLIVQSKPSGARVTVGGVYRGQTPLTLALRPNLSSALELSSPGYEQLTRAVQLGPGERSTLGVELEAILGQVTIRSNHPDAEVLVDGVSSGRANATLSLPSTEHRIEVRKPGFVAHQVSVTPRPGFAQVIEATLRTESESRAARAAPLLSAAGGIELRLMPHGSFTMGSSRRERGRRANEAPRNVELRRPFYLGTREITNVEFRRFRAAHQSGVFSGVALNLEAQPVVQVSWQDAAAFCNWLSQQDGLPPAYQQQGGELVAVSPMNHGYRLPTEAEWEWAARRRPDGTLWRYPWGDELPVAARSGNYADRSARTPLQDVVADYDDGFLAAAPVGSFAASDLGLFDMGGNVAEWTTDLYTSSYPTDAVAVDPLNGGAGNQHVVRGASWRSGSAVDLRSAIRNAGVAPRDDLGFRIARYAE